MTWWILLIFLQCLCYLKVSPIILLIFSFFLFGKHLIALTIQQFLNKFLCELLHFVPIFSNENIKSRICHTIVRNIPQLVDAFLLEHLGLTWILIFIVWSSCMLVLVFVYSTKHWGQHMYMSYWVWSTTL